ncbi:leucine-rich repeat domain-containing protein [Treponema sp. OMZ 840]|uniref:InlB B-repeat-containing protein n=1 Tax=Treponema sp. OMZ 840 TaxID=244313 RepID=UPI003D8DE748
MKNSNKNKSAKRFTSWAAVLALAASLVIMGLLTACPNAAGGGGGGTTPVPKYEVKFGVDGANGTLKAKSDGIAETETSPISVEKGKTVTFTAAPASGYRVKGWTLDGSAVNGNNSTYSLNITKAVTVKVSFEDDSTPLPQHAVTFSVEGVNGTLSAKADGAPLTSGNTVQEGKAVTFTAAPNPGYEVKEWKITGAGMTFEEGTGTTQNNTACVILKAPLTVKVVFKEKTLTPKHLVTMTAGAHGSISADPALPSDGMVEEGKKIVFTASPDSDYAVDKWNITGGQVLSGGTEGSGTAMVKITGPVTVQVTFKVKTFKVDFGVAGTPPNGSLSAVYKEGGAVFTSGTQVPENTLLVFTAAPDAGFKVEKWTVNNETVAGNTANTYEHRVTKAAQITVSFVSSVAIPNEFTLTNGEKYKVTDKVKKHVIMTEASTSQSGVYTLSTAVEYEGITYTLTGFDKDISFGYLSAFALSGESDFLSVAGGVLFDKAQTKLIRYPMKKAGTSYTVPESVRVLGNSSFYYCENLTSVILPDGLTTIENRSFLYCEKLATVNLPSSLTSIGSHFLAGAAVEAVTIPEGISGLLGQYFLNDCEKLKTLELPSTLTDIKASYFCRYCTAIESVTCKAAAPPVTSSSSFFTGVNLSGVTLKVPAGSEAAYQAANGWKKFGTITALP